MELEKRLLAFAIEELDNPDSQLEKDKKSKEDKEKDDPKLMELKNKIINKADELKKYCHDASEQQSVEKWRNSIWEKNPTMEEISKVLKREEEFLEAAKTRESMIDHVNKANIAKPRKEQFLKGIEAIWKDKTVKPAEKAKHFRENIVEPINQHKKTYKELKRQRKELNAVAEQKAGKIGLRSKDEMKKWKKDVSEKIFRKYLSGENDNYTADKMFSDIKAEQTKLETENRERGEVAQQRQEISKIFTNLKDSTDPKGQVSLGISAELKTSFNGLDLNGRKKLLSDIHKKVAKKIKGGNTGKNAPDALNIFLNQQREYPKNPEERFKAREEQGLAMNDWSQAKEHFKKSRQEVENDEDLKPKDKKQWSEKFAKYEKECEIGTTLKGFKQEVDTISNTEATSESDQENKKQRYNEILKSIGQHEKDAKDNPLLKENIKELKDQIAENVQKDLSKKLETNENKDFGAIEELIKDDTEAENLFMNIVSLRYEESYNQSKGQALEKNMTTEDLEEDIMKQAIDGNKNIADQDAEKVINKMRDSDVSNEIYWEEMVQEEDQKAVERDGRHIFEQAMSGVNNGMERFDGQQDEDQTKLEEGTVNEVNTAQQDIEAIKRRPDAIKRSGNTILVDNSERLLKIQRKREDKEALHRTIDHNEKLVNMDTQTDHLDREKKVQDYKNRLLAKAKTPKQRDKLNTEIDSLKRNNDMQKKASKLLRQ